MTRLVQIRNGDSRAVAVVQEPQLRLLNGVESVLHLSQEAVRSKISLTGLIQQRATGDLLNYDPIYQGQSQWRLLPAMDHPEEPARCLVSGTGLTHFGSAKNRQAMHETKESELTDSMKMFRWGAEGGKPARGKIGVAPEWFYKGCGTILRAHGEKLVVPAYAEDGGEEAEIAGVYFIDEERQPCRIGMAVGNEFSDHKFERKNYLNLASSKIRTCALGPELVIGADFQSLRGQVRIERHEQELWSKEIATGESEMCHTVQNIEHHHFKFETHRRPGDIHIHYFGAHSLSVGDGVQLADGDLMEISFSGFGRPLRNPLHIERGEPSLVKVRPLA
jgi:hypothetical protein